MYLLYRLQGIIHHLHCIIIIREHVKGLAQWDVSFAKDHRAEEIWRSDAHEHIHDGAAGSWTAHDVTCEIIPGDSPAAIAETLTNKILAEKIL